MNTMKSSRPADTQIRHHAAIPTTRFCRVGFSDRTMTPFLLMLPATLLASGPAALADSPCVNWTRRSPATSPPARNSHTMAYDSARGVTVLFGGNVGGQSSLGDTWEWDGTNWAQRSPAISPPARWSHTMVYDSVRDVTVLFGGISFDGGPHYFGDTWEWNGTNWTQRNVTGS